MFRFFSTLVLLSFTLTSVQAGTTVTTYTYNPDGALTAVTERTGVATATTTYLTWDNFLPDADDPATGTIYTGNGNLLAIGPEPGKATKQFSFDERNRLTNFQATDKASIYGYHADGLMASATADNGSGLGFYYAGSSMANLRQTDNDLWSARLGPVRYLDDGTEEILLAPRKDVAGVYDPDARTVTAYKYDDAFGAESDVPLADGYDLKDNPHRYAGEFRDPLWGGYYLKARWYEPDLGIFLSRDPVSGYHPYNYGDGNPVMNIDPTGTSTKRSGAAQFAWDVFIEPLAQLGESKDGWSYAFLAAGILVELGFGAIEYDIFKRGLFLSFRMLHVDARFGMHNMIDGLLMTGQTVASSFNSEGKFKPDLFAYNTGVTAAQMGLLGTARALGLDYRKHTLRGKDVSKIIMKGSPNHYLVFDVRADVHSWLPNFNSPIMETKSVGFYHSKLIAASKEYAYISEFGKAEIKGKFYGYHHQLGVPGKSKGKYATMSMGLGTKDDIFATSDYTYAYVGKTPESKKLPQMMRNVNPNDGLKAESKYHPDDYKAILEDPAGQGVKEYSLRRNNCHMHKNKLLQLLRRDNLPIQ